MGFFKRFTKPRTNVSLHVSKSSFALGEDVKGTITVESNEEINVKQIRLKLWCRESKKKTRIERDEEGRETQSAYWDSAILFSHSPKMSGSFHLASGSKNEYPFIVNIPAGGRESYYSIDGNVKWFLEAVVDVEGRRSPSSGVYEVQIIKPSAVPAIVKEKEVVTREVVLIPCAYCGGLMPQTSTFCPNCGARRKS
jgi:hypothetical protein